MVARVQSVKAFLSSRRWMLLAAVWLSLAIFALINGKLLNAGLYASFLVLAFDGYGRDRRCSERSSRESEPASDTSLKDGELPESPSLSLRETWQRNRCLARGEAPADPQRAASAIELAEAYQGRGKVSQVAYLCGFMTMTFCFAGLAIAAAVHGEVVLAVLYGPLALAMVAFLAFSPAFRPRNMARSREAAERIVAAPR